MSDEETPETPAERMERMREVGNELRRRREARGRDNIPDRRPQPNRSLETIDLVAYTSKLTYNSRGDVVWTVVVPHQYHEMADTLPLTYAMPLHVTVQKWSPLDAVRSAD